MSVYIIAEAGCNHCGNMDLAQRMLEAASLAGADCVKFQTFRADLLINADDIRKFCRTCELSLSDHERLIQCCANIFFFKQKTAYDIPSLNLLHGLNVANLKIPSGQIHNAEYLDNARRLFSRGKIYMSTGMSAFKEWRRAYGSLAGCNVVPMHCVTGYPVPLEQANMRGIRDIISVSAQRGYSDHTMTNTCAVMAVAMRCSVIEHHFYLDEVDCPDMPASFCIAKLRAYIQCIRDAEIAMGAGCRKIIQPCEGKYLKRRDLTRYSDNKQGIHIKGQNSGVSGVDISGNVS